MASSVDQQWAGGAQERKESLIETALALGASSSFSRRWCFVFFFVLFC